MAGTQCLTVCLLVVLQQASRTWASIGQNENKIVLDVSGSVDSGALLYKFPHISGYRYLVPGSPESKLFFLSNSEGLTTTSKLHSLQNQNISLSICEELETETKLVPVDLRVRTSLEVPLLYGSIAENRPPGTPVTFVNNSLDRILAEYPVARPDYIATSRDFVVNADGKRQLETTVKLDYEYQKLHRFTIFEAVTKNAVAHVEIAVENVNDNLPVFNQSRYSYTLSPGVRRFSKVGKVSAYDLDGDKIVYSLAKTYPCCVVIPQTGEIIVVELPLFPTYLSVIAHEKDTNLR